MARFRAKIAKIMMESRSVGFDEVHETEFQYFEDLIKES